MSTGLHARRATGLIGGREAVELDPDRIDGEVIAGGRVASRVTERDGRFNFFVF